MCLNTITQKENLPETIIGYKVVSSHYTPLYYCQSYFYFSLNKEVVDIQQSSIGTISGERYQTGFHVFKNWKDAQLFRYLDEKIIKVLCKNLVCFGKQKVSDKEYKHYFVDVIVCKNITNLGDCNNYDPNF